MLVLDIIGFQSPAAQRCIVDIHDIREAMRVTSMESRSAAPRPSWMYKTWGYETNRLLGIEYIYIYNSNNNDNDNDNNNNNNDNNK